MKRIWKKIAFFVIANMIALAAPAQAGTQLQVQFQRWSYDGGGLATLLVTLRNPTTKPFASVVWDCDLYDRDKRLVGRSSLVFNVVPWGSLVVDTQPVATNGMFENAECRLMLA